MAIDLIKIETLATNLVAEVNQFLDGVRLINRGQVLEEPLTTAQRGNIRNRAKVTLTGIETTIQTIRSEINA